jgi:small GTP-binding protein
MKTLSRIDRRIQSRLSNFEPTSYYITKHGVARYKTDNNQNVIELQLNCQELKIFPLEICNLSKLKKLNLGNTNIEHIPSEIKQLKNLTHLNLSSCLFSKFPIYVCNLSNLEELYIGSNQIKELPSDIKKLKKLTTLIMYSNFLSKLNDSIKELKNLKYLDLDRNKFKKFPKEIKYLTNLQILLMRFSNIKIFPSDIIELKNLKIFDISYNNIKNLPSKLLESKLELIDDSFNENFVNYIDDIQVYASNIFESYLKNINTPKGIFIKDNPIEEPPLLIIRKGRDAINEYFKSLLKSKKKKINEVKILLIGDGCAGKTSLLKRIFGEPIDKNESQTHGINIRDWNININNEQIIVHFWDFGGQEIMHATHQFFLSEKSLYVLVLDGRKEEDVEYWLKHIESFGGTSPILIVLNKIDQNPLFNVNKNFLLEKYKGIKGFYKLSCETQVGLKDFINRLKKEILNVELRKTKIAQNWINIKTALENMKRDFISYDEYLEMCHKEKILDEIAQNTLVEYLNALGIVLHFKDFELLDTHVLDPRWVTEGVYKIINSPVISNKNGILSFDDLDTILQRKEIDDKYYPQNKYQFIINLMKKFELCYSINDNTLLIPDLLEIQQPIIPFEYGNCLEYVIKYDFLPKSIIHRFIVRMNKNLEPNKCWRTGTYLECELTKCKALVKADDRERKISIFVNGERKRDFFSVIRHTIREINDSYKKLSFSEFIPLPDHKDILVDYDELIGHEMMGISDLIVGKIRKKYPVPTLLNGIENPELRKRQFNNYNQPNIIFQNQNIQNDTSKSYIDVRQKLQQKIDIKIESILPVLQTDFDQFKDKLIELEPRLERKLNEISDSMDNLNINSSQEKYIKPMNKLGRFLQKAADKNTELNTLINNSQGLIELIKKIASGYSLISQWIPGLPLVPNIFI